MTFVPETYENFIAVPNPVQARISPSYTGAGTDFDIIIGSGMGGGVLADDLADRRGDSARILVIEAGTHLYPTHVYNCSRLPNDAVARRFGCGTFFQSGDEHSANYIHERPQLNLGGRSIFWSGLIPTLQGWELDFFPPHVRSDLEGSMLALAGETMNQSVSLGRTAREIVQVLREGPLAADFEIIETPRALHQPYLQPDGAPVTENLVTSTGVFNTAELLINQLGLSSNENSGGDGPGLRLLLNHFVEDVRRLDDQRLELVVRDTLGGDARFFRAGTVVLACGSIESPKLLARSTLGRELPPEAAGHVGIGLTDHPTTSSIEPTVRSIGGFDVPRDANAKIVFYSRGERDAEGRIRFPFNVEMNVNHEYWHLRENDPTSPDVPIVASGESIVDIKFSFGNCLDPDNAIRPAPPFGYVPEIVFRNQNWTDHLVGSRLPALAGWQRSAAEVFGLLNEVMLRIFAEFRDSAGAPCAPRDGARYGEAGRGFGYGTVHHAAGSLRMPYKERYDGPVRFDSVVDEDLRVNGTSNLYVCDMSVMPFASAANPLRTLVALALRLSHHLG